MGVVGEHGDDEHVAARQVLRGMGDEPNAVDIGQPEIHQQDVGALQVEHGQARLAGADGGDKAERGIAQHRVREPPHEFRLVLHDQHPGCHLSSWQHRTIGRFCHRPPCRP